MGKAKIASGGGLYIKNGVLKDYYAIEGDIGSNNFVEVVGGLEVSLEGSNNTTKVPTRSKKTAHMVAHVGNDVYFTLYINSSDGYLYGMVSKYTGTSWTHGTVKQISNTHYADTYRYNLCAIGVNKVIITSGKSWPEAIGLKALVIDPSGLTFSEGVELQDNTPGKSNLQAVIALTDDHFLSVVQSSKDSGYPIVRVCRLDSSNNITILSRKTLTTSVYSGAEYYDESLLHIMKETDTEWLIALTSIGTDLPETVFFFTVSKDYNTVTLKAVGQDGASVRPDYTSYAAKLSGDTIAFLANDNSSYIYLQFRLYKLNGSSVQKSSIYLSPEGTSAGTQGAFIIGVEEENKAVYVYTDKATAKTLKTNVLQLGDNLTLTYGDTAVRVFNSTSVENSYMCDTAEIHRKLIAWTNSSNRILFRMVNVTPDGIKLAESKIDGVTKTSATSTKKGRVYVL